MIKVRIYHQSADRLRAIVHDGLRWRRLDEWQLDGHRVTPANQGWHGWNLPVGPMTYTRGRRTAAAWQSLTACDRYGRLSPVQADSGLGPPGDGSSDVGECWVSRNADGSLQVVRADQRVFISETLIEEWERGPHHLHPDVEWGDGILTIRGSNRTVSYGCIRRYSERLRLAVLSPEPPP